MHGQYEATPPAQPARTRTRAAELAFEGVEFRYPDAPPGSPPVLHDVNLRIAPIQDVRQKGQEFVIVHVRVLHAGQHVHELSERSIPVRLLRLGLIP